jgi:hypothetical protein
MINKATGAYGVSARPWRGRRTFIALAVVILALLSIGAAQPLAGKGARAPRKPTPSPAKRTTPKAAASAARTLIVIDRGNLASYSLSSGKTERLTTDGTLFDAYSTPAMGGSATVAMLKGGNVFCFDLKRRALLQITTDGLPPESSQRWYTCPQASPDGKTIAALFTDNTGDNPVHEVAFLSADGRDRRSVPTDEALDGASLGRVKFSPGGKQVAFTFFSDTEDDAGVATTGVTAGKVRVVYEPVSHPGETQVATDVSFDDLFWQGDSSLLISLSTYDQDFNLSYAPRLYSVAGKVTQMRLAWPNPPAGSDVVVSPIGCAASATLALRASNLTAVSNADKGTAYFEILEVTPSAGAGKVIFSRQQPISDFSSFDGLRLIPGAHLVAVVTSEVKQLGTKGEGALPATAKAAATPAVRQPITFYSALVLDFSGKPVADLTDLTDPTILAAK